MKTIPSYAMPDFLQVILAYGAYLKLKEIVSTVKIKYDEKNINREIDSHRFDPYSRMYREHGISEGLSSYNANRLKENISENLKETEDSANKELVEKLISSEKYFKRLRFEFKEKYKELSELFDLHFNASKKQMKKDKVKSRMRTKAIKSLSPKFSRFLNCCLYNDKISLNRFIEAMNLKYNIFDRKELENLYSDYIYEEGSIAKELSIDQMYDLSKLLSEFIDKTIEESKDIGNFITKKENFILSEKILKKDYNKLVKLNDEYKKIVHFYTHQ